MWRNIGYGFPQFDARTWNFQNSQLKQTTLLMGKVPVGIMASIEPGEVSPTVSPKSVAKEKDRAPKLHAKVWGSTTCSGVQSVRSWSKRWGLCICQGTKVRLMHNLNGTNA